MKEKHPEAVILEVLGNVAMALGVAFGQPAAGASVRAVTRAAAEAFRVSDADTDRIVDALKHIDGPRMPWGPWPRSTRPRR